MYTLGIIQAVIKDTLEKEEDGSEGKKRNC